MAGRGLAMRRGFVFLPPAARAPVATGLPPRTARLPALPPRASLVPVFFLRAAERTGRRVFFLPLTTARSPRAPLHRDQASSG